MKEGILTFPLLSLNINTILKMGPPFETGANPNPFLSNSLQSKEGKCKWLHKFVLAILFPLFVVDPVTLYLCDIFGLK
jgi:hypothetical protein